LKQVRQKGQKPNENPVGIDMMTPNLHEPGNKHQQHWLLQRMKSKICTHLQSVE